jgi:hypothetical protein
VPDLGVEADALIEAGRGALRPIQGDRERVARALGTLLGGLPTAVATAAPRTFGWSMLSVVVVGLSAGGLLVAGVLESEDSSAITVRPALAAVSPSPPSVTPANVPRATGDEPAPSPEQLSVAAPPAVSEPQARAPKRRSSALSEEVEILSRAETELHAGRFAGALQALELHAKKFPAGTLAPERRAARIHALCGLGRVAEADGELARLSPGSLHEARAREACAARRSATAE